MRIILIFILFLLLGVHAQRKPAMKPDSSDSVQSNKPISRGRARFSLDNISSDELKSSRAPTQTGGVSVRRRLEVATPSSRNYDVYESSEQLPVESFRRSGKPRVITESHFEAKNVSPRRPLFEPTSTPYVDTTNSVPIEELIKHFGSSTIEQYSPETTEILATLPFSKVSEPVNLETTSESDLLELVPVTTSMAKIESTSTKSDLRREFVRKQVTEETSNLKTERVTRGPIRRIVGRPRISSNQKSTESSQVHSRSRPQIQVPSTRRPDTSSVLPPLKGTISRRTRKRIDSSVPTEQSRNQSSLLAEETRDAPSRTRSGRRFTNLKGDITPQSSQPESDLRNSKLNFRRNSIRRSQESTITQENTTRNSGKRAPLNFQPRDSIATTRTTSNPIRSRSRFRDVPPRIDEQKLEVLPLFGNEPKTVSPVRVPSSRRRNLVDGETSSNENNFKVYRNEPKTVPSLLVANSSRRHNLVESAVQTSATKTNVKFVRKPTKVTRTPLNSTVKPQEETIQTSATENNAKFVRIPAKVSRMPLNSTTKRQERTSNFINKTEEIVDKVGTHTSLEKVDINEVVARTSNVTASEREVSNKTRSKKIEEPVRTSTKKAKVKESVVVSPVSEITSKKSLIRKKNSQSKEQLVDKPNTEKANEKITKVVVSEPKVTVNEVISTSRGKKITFNMSPSKSRSKIISEINLTTLKSKSPGISSSEEEIDESDNYPEPFKALLQAKKQKKEPSLPIYTNSGSFSTSAPEKIVTSSNRSKTETIDTTYSSESTKNGNLDNELEPRLPPTSSSTRSRKWMTTTSKIPNRDRGQLTPTRRTKFVRSTTFQPLYTIEPASDKYKFHSKFSSSDKNDVTFTSPSPAGLSGKVFSPKAPRGLYSSRKSNDNDIGQFMSRDPIESPAFTTQISASGAAAKKSNKFSARYRGDSSFRSTAGKSTTNAPVYIPTIPTAPYIPTVPTVTPPTVRRNRVKYGVESEDKDIGLEVITFDDPVNTVPSANLVSGEYLSSPTENPEPMVTNQENRTKSEKPVSIFERIINSITAISTTTAPESPTTLSTPGSESAKGSAILKLVTNKPTKTDKTINITDTDSPIQVSALTTEKPTTIIERILSSLSALQANSTVIENNSIQVGNDFSTLSYSHTSPILKVTKPTSSSILSAHSSTSVNPLVVFDELSEEQVLQKRTIGKLLTILNGLTSTTQKNEPTKLVLVTPKVANFISGNTRSTVFDSLITSTPAQTDVTLASPELFTSSFEISSTTKPPTNFRQSRILADMSTTALNTPETTTTQQSPALSTTMLYLPDLEPQSTSTQTTITANSPDTTLAIPTDTLISIVNSEQTTQMSTTDVNKSNMFSTSTSMPASSTESNQSTLSTITSETTTFETTEPTERSEGNFTNISNRLGVTPLLVTPKASTSFGALADANNVTTDDGRITYTFTEPPTILSTTFTFPPTLPTLSRFEVSPGSVSIFSANELSNYITPEDNSISTVTISSRANADPTVTTESTTSELNTENDDVGSSTIPMESTFSTETISSSVASTENSKINPQESTTQEFDAISPTDSYNNSNGNSTNITMLSNRSGRLLNIVQDPIQNNIDASSTPASSTPDYFIFAVLNNNTILRKRPSSYPTKDTPFLIVGVYPNNSIVRKFVNGTLVPMDPVIRVSGFDTRVNPPLLPEITSNQVTPEQGSPTDNVNRQMVDVDENTVPTVDANPLSLDITRRLSTERTSFLVNTIIPTSAKASTVVSSSSSTTDSIEASMVSTTVSYTSAPVSTTSTTTPLPTLSELLNGRTVQAFNNLINRTEENYETLQINQSPTTTETPTTTSIPNKYSTGSTSTGRTSQPSASTSITTSTFVTTTTPSVTSNRPLSPRLTTTPTEITREVGINTYLSPALPTSIIPSSTTLFPSTTFFPTFFTTLFPTLKSRQGRTMSTLVSTLPPSTTTLVESSESAANLNSETEVSTLPTIPPTVTMSSKMIDTGASRSTNRVTRTTTGAPYTTKRRVRTTLEPSTTLASTFPASTSSNISEVDHTEKINTSTVDKSSTTTEKEVRTTKRIPTRKGKSKELTEEQKKNLQILAQLEREQADILKQLSFLTRLNIGGMKPPTDRNNLANRVIALAVDREKQRATTTQSPEEILELLLATEKTRQAKKQSETVESLLKQYNLEGVKTTPLEDVRSTYGKSDEAILASILKEQGIGPSTPKSLEEQLMQAEVQRGLTTKKPKTTTQRQPGRIMQGLSWLLNVLAPQPTTRKPKLKKPKVETETLSHQPTHITPVVTAAPKQRFSPNSLSQEDIKKLINQLENIQKDPKNAGELDYSQIKSLQNLITTNEGVQVISPGQNGATSRAEVTRKPKSKKSRTTTEKITTFPTSIENSEDDFATPKPTSSLPRLRLNPVPGIDDERGAPMIRGQLITAAVNVTRAISSFLGTALQGAAHSLQSVWG